MQISRVRQRAELPRLLGRLAAQTGQVLSIAKAARDVGLTPSTAEDYVRLLEAVFLVHRLPAWGTTLRSVVDSGLATRLLRVSAETLASPRPTSMTEFGHLLESFCVAEVLKQCSWSDRSVLTGHWPTHDGQEVDLVLERDDGAVAGVEVKAGSRITPSDLKGLRALRDRLGSSFIGGVVLSTGTRSYTADTDLYVLPVDRLWTT